MSIITDIYRNMQRRHPSVLFYGDPTRHEIALTFDDGPHPRDTPQVLDVLAKHGIHATFFLVGQYVEQYPQLVKRIHESGHHIGIHCYRHLPFPLENASTLKGQLDRSRNAIANACGISPDTIRDIRPPYGIFTSRTLSYLTEWGYHLVMWSSIPQHWMQPTNWTVRQVLDETVPGAVIVLHDGHGHGRKVTQILEVIIPKLKSMKFQFVTIEQIHSMESASSLANTQEQAPAFQNKGEHK
ncbi:MAG: polysaccharide deacetylase family protein [Anaerolineales bacterium]|nr:polysaccharide deacetylase family protein [Anaerolineales bacterium]